MWGFGSFPENSVLLLKARKFTKLLIIFVIMISIVIPVYNVSRYLSRCLDSILAQSVSDWEAICVDDGSTDGSSAVLDSYAANDSRIKVFHTTNQGASRARNFALKKVTGTYLMMIDSDDFIHPQTFEICLNHIERNNSDAVMFTYNRKYRTLTIIRHFLHLGDYLPLFPLIDDSKVSEKVSDDIFEWATEYSHPEDIDIRWAVKHCQPWRGLFRAERIKDITFIPEIIYEDFPWWSEVLLQLRKVSIINLPLYFYYPNTKGYIFSSSQQYRIDSLRKAIDSAEKIYTDESVTAYQKQMWTKNFLVPFRNKLAKKTSTPL